MTWNRSLHLIVATIFAISSIVGCNQTAPTRYQASLDESPVVEKNSARQLEITPVSLVEALEKVDSLDWPYWRGPEYNGISRETGLIDNWNPKGGEGSNVSWKRDDLGGRSTPIVMNGKLYMIVRDQRGMPTEGEKVVCLDAQSGETIWENRFNVWLSDVPDFRVAWSSVVGDPQTGKVYALGVCGYFQCLDGETGKTLWSVPMHEQFGLLSTYGGRTNFPIIHENLVIVSAVVIGWGDMAKPAQQFVAFDKQSGEVVWFNGTRPLPYDTTYSAPSLAVLDGQQALVFGSGDGAVWAFQPRTGRPLWQYKFSRRGLNIAPVVVGNKVYSGHSEENIVGAGGVATMGAIAAIDGSGKGDISTSGQLWQINELMMGKSSPIVIGDRIYCFDDRAKVHVLDLKTGEPVARKKALGTSMRASPLYADGKIYAFTENGRWYILAPDEKLGVKVLKKGRLPTGESTNASPIVSHGKLYLHTTGGLYCLEDKSKKHGVDSRPETPKETPASEDQTPAHVQISPAELLLQSGQSQQFKVKLFNSRGQFLKDSVAEFMIEGPGEISTKGVYKSAADSKQAAVIVTAKVGELTGRARIRITPPLPWEFTFDDLSDPPVTWVGARYRHIIREVDGEKVMVKITTIPKGARSRAWFGSPSLNNYTIQADIRGQLNNKKMPDIGLVAHGYVLDLQGASEQNKKLQLRSWSATLRMAETIDFDWKPDTWYTMKLQASIEGEKAVLKGKVWPRDQKEPADWTIEAVDDSPNLTGSPGLYGSAKTAEIYLDNIKVYSN